MADYPSLPLWTDAYLADLHPRLTLEQHGCMILLMQFAWRRPSCDLPDDDKQVARMLSISAGRWKTKLKPIMEELWIFENDVFFNKRLRKERDFVATKTQSLKDRGRKGGIAKALNNNETPLAGLHSSSSQNVAPTPTPTPIKDTSTNVEDAGASLDVVLYRRGKEVLGKNSGGQITKLRKAMGTDEDALAIIDEAAEKESPAEYVAGVIRNQTPAKIDYDKIERDVAARVERRTKQRQERSL